VVGLACPLSNNYIKYNFPGTNESEKWKLFWTKIESIPENKCTGGDSKLRGKVVVLLSEQIDNEVELLTLIGSTKQDHPVTASL
jgi:hypothetical protein